MSENNDALETIAKLVADGKITITKVVSTGKCGHPIDRAKNTGIPSWQNRWTCEICGKSYSR